MRVIERCGVGFCYACLRTGACKMLKREVFKPMFSIKTVFVALSLVVASVSTAAVKGQIDGIARSGDGLNIYGWACDLGIEKSIDVHLYVQPSNDQAQIVGGYLADHPNESAVNAACGTQASAHRFNIPLTSLQGALLAEQSIHIYGISTRGQSNLPLNNSGKFRLPPADAVAPDVGINPLKLSDLKPQVNGDIVIPQGAHVVIDQNFKGGYIRVEGVLACPEQPTSPLRLQASGILVDGPRARLSCGTAAKPFAGNLEIELSGAPTEGMMHTRGIAAVGGGTLSLHAVPRGMSERTRLGVTANPGDNTIHLAAPMTGWRAGQEIVIAATGHAVHENERRTIIDISADRKTITLNMPLSFYHHGVTEQYSNGQKTWRLDQRAHIINLTRSISISSVNDSHYSSQGFGAHTMVMPGSRAFIDGVKFYRVGQMGELGRYPFHWHKVGNADGQYVRNSLVLESKQRCYTIHGTNNATLENNACYDHFGHGYFLEDGNETGNKITNNIGIFSRKTPEDRALLVSDFSDGGIGRQRVDGPSTYWIAHPSNRVTDNISVASEGSGFWMAFSEEVLCDHPGCRPTDDVNPFAGGIQISPVRASTTAFDGNQASTNTVGMTWDGAPDTSRPLGNRLNPRDFQLRSAHYRVSIQPHNLVMYKSNEAALYFRGNYAIFENAIFADNVWNAFLANNQGLSNTLIVAKSSNNNYPSGVNNPLDSRMIAGALLYDGPLDLVNTHFANFDIANSRPFMLIGGSGKFTNVVRSATFDPAPYAVVDMTLTPGNWGDDSVTSLRDAGRVLDSYAPDDNRTLFKPNEPINFVDSRVCTEVPNARHTIRCDHGAATLKFAYPSGGLTDNVSFTVSRLLAGAPERTVFYRPENTSGLFNKFPVIVGENFTYRVDNLFFPNIPAAEPFGFTVRYTAENATDVSPIILFSNTTRGCLVNRMRVNGLTEVSMNQLNAGAANAFVRTAEGIVARFRGSRNNEYHAPVLTPGVTEALHVAHFRCP